ncbi:hypothetical protein AAFM48_12015 [Burkholderia pseudomallei]
MNIGLNAFIFDLRGGNRAGDFEAASSCPPRSPRLPHDRQARGERAVRHAANAYRVTASLISPKWKMFPKKYGFTAPRGKFSILRAGCARALL